MANTNYKTEALEILLDKSCLPERYYPLIQYKEMLVCRLKEAGCETKEAIKGLSDEELTGLGLPASFTGLFRKFLCLYDMPLQKRRELEKLDLDPERKASFEQLYLLPGVKQTRARLYFESGYRSLEDFAKATPEEIIERTAKAIRDNKMTCIVPKTKEVCTHIAVAKAFVRS